MKKDKKFLEELGTYLNKSKYKDEIISKYEDIIKKQKEEGKKIKYILKDLGEPKDIAEKELKEYKKNNSSNIIISIKNKFNSLKNKLKKNNKEKEKKTKEKKIKDKKTKDKKIKDNKIKNKKGKEKKTKEKNKVSFKDKFKNLFKKKQRKVTNTPKEIVEEIKEEVSDKISDVSEIVSEKNIFESKSSRIKRIILKTLGIIFTCILVFIWLWITIMFFASLFAYLDGIKFKGIILLLLGIDLLVLWIVIMINRAIFKKPMSARLNLIIIFILVAIIAFSVVYTFKEIKNIQNVQDVSEKYSMIRKLETYDLPSESNEKFIVTFNSNYNTQYVIKHDKNIKGKVKIDVRYYECYYDYYSKKNSNGVYVSLKLDNRDRFSVILDDIKEGKIYDGDELSRYTVTISVNPKEANKVAIQR